MRSVTELCEREKIYFRCTTDKEPLTYRFGEDMHFHFELCDAEGERVGCPKISCLTRADGREETRAEFEGRTGELDVCISPAVAGFVYLCVNACDGEGKPYPFAEACNAGAGADVEMVKKASPEPSDFDEFWRDTVSVLYDVEPRILRFEKLDPVKWGFEPEKYTTYDVRIESVDGEYASGFLSIPYDAARGECALRLDFHGYGFGNAYGKYVPKTIVFDVIAHSMPAAASKEEIAEAQSKPPFKGYGFWDGRNNDRDTVYFKNMILRDLQAVRFLTSYFGSEEGGMLWDGKTIGTRGGSQGAFQAMAVGALLRYFDLEPSFLIFNMPWLCDVGGEKFSSRYRSRFFPEYTEALLYYDTVSFASRITCEAEGGETGLGDTCAIPSATMSCYNALRGKKSIRYFQNGVHGGHGKFFTEYKLEKK